MNHKYIDLMISTAEPSILSNRPTHYRKCSITRRGDQQFINLKLPHHVQEMIVEAYEQGKEVRIFA